MFESDSAGSNALQAMSSSVSRDPFILVDFTQMAQEIARVERPICARH